MGSGPLSKLGQKLGQLGNPMGRAASAARDVLAERGPALDVLLALEPRPFVAPQTPAKAQELAIEAGLAVGLGLPGELVETALGPLRRCVTSFGEGHCHGSARVSSALSALPADLAVLALDPSLSEVDFSRALYIDTETTGLLGGAGTLPFLIGCARFVGELGSERSLVVEQFLLERPGLEAPMLTRFGELLAEASCIVSFNGKSFDWPLLRTRFILNRVAAPKVKAHLDLLHCARRVFKRRLGTVRLIHLEQEVLGFARVDDLPGALIPETYLAFLRGRAGGETLRPIVEHNLSDLVALPALLGELARRFALDGQDGVDETGRAVAQDARDKLGFAQVAARADEHSRALIWAEAAADQEVRGHLASEALYLSGLLKLKQGDWASAEQTLLLALAAWEPHSELSSRAHLVLAKHFEHKRKDFARAADHARHTQLSEGDAASARRQERLMRKLQTREAGVL